MNGLLQSQALFLGIGYQALRYTSIYQSAQCHVTSMKISSLTFHILMRLLFHLAPLNQFGPVLQLSLSLSFHQCFILIHSATTDSTSVFARQNHSTNAPYTMNSSIHHSHYIILETDCIIGQHIWKYKSTHPLHYGVLSFFRNISEIVSALPDLALNASFNYKQQ
jgi:hypothetical protein